MTRKEITLTPSQERNNIMLRFEIQQEELEFKYREEKAKAQQEAWDKAHPDGIFIISDTGEKINIQSKMCMNMIGRRKVIGIWYE
jgi:hypothetical protein